MTTCLKCGDEFIATSKNGYTKKYCSRACANSRTHTLESNLQRSVSNKKYWDNLSDKDRLEFHRKTQINGRKHTALALTELLEMDFTLIKAHCTRRKRIILEQKEMCLKCGINDWEGNPITLELDHIDGNNMNNNRDNLRGLCPNCHSQTSTWRGRKNR